MLDIGGMQSLIQLLQIIAYNLATKFVFHLHLLLNSEFRVNHFILILKIQLFT